MNTKSIDLANIALMVVSCLAAFMLPFELFIFSYAVLGPLHYLTEINWLHKRNYFATGKKDYYWLVLLCIILTILSLVATYRESAFVNPLYVFLTGTFGEGVFDIITVLIFLSFAIALSMVLFKDWVYKIAFFAFAVILGAAFSKSSSFVFLFGIFLPTLIHVFIFTGLFILYGALKNKSLLGGLSLFVFVGCAISFFVFQPQFAFYKASVYAEKALIDSGFVQLNKAVLDLFKLGEFTRETVFNSAIGLGIMRFIAFAYTYHYLNWFSKTQIIKWHEVPRKQLATVILLWLSSIALYAYNYKTGLMVLYFLSMLHVLLEFPLNYRSIIGIWDEMKLLTGLSKPALAVKRK
jgi:hypothetical protein